ncbi:MAG: D-alanyl-D-alanine carboxypeptidase [Tyzzerella sp.]|nr:D-alanyl-D-alanine carboxypeptidase [Tyzzerella sp.]
MKCIDKKRRRRRNRKKELRIRLVCTVVFLLFGLCVVLYLTTAHKRLSKYESITYHTSVYQASLFAKDFCVASEDVDFEDFYRNDKFHGALLFDIEKQEVIYSESVNERLYPASTTKIMTAYLALKYGNMNDYVTVSKNAVNVPSDSSTAHLQKGDILSLKDLLYALMLPSGNDSAVAIAEHISGSSEAFVELMNEEALALGATNTHFVNPHGYQDKEHYTTAYDLYLIFKECIKDELFLQIIASKSYDAVIRQSNGTTRTVTWPQSNQFISGGREIPKDVTLIGGKTGNTFDAGSCILLYGHDSQQSPFITIMMGATSRRNLYDNMTSLLRAIK